MKSWLKHTLSIVLLLILLVLSCPMALAEQAPDQDRLGGEADVTDFGVDGESTVLSTAQNHTQSQALYQAPAAAVTLFSDEEPVLAPGDPFQLGTVTYGTLQAAVDAAEDGAEILVLQDAEIAGTVTVSGKNITLKSSGNGKFTLYRAAGFTTGELIKVADDGGLTLDSLVFDGRAYHAAPDIANAQNWTYMYIPLINGENDLKAETSMLRSAGTLRAKNVTFQNAYCTSYYAGGAITVERGSIALDSCVFDHDLSQRGAGVYIIGTRSAEGVYSIPSGEFKNCTFQNCFCHGSAGSGAGVCATNVKSLVFENCDFLDNTVSRYNGGGFTAEFSGNYKDNDMQLTVANCNFERCTVGNDGFAISYSCSGTFRDCKFIENTGLAPRQSVAALSCGGGQSMDTTTVIERCLFDGNKGATSCFGDHAAYKTVTVRDCTFRNNQSQEDFYGVFLLYSSDTTFENCVFEDNYGVTFKCGTLLESTDVNYFPKLTVKNCKVTDNEGNNIISSYQSDGTELNRTHTVRVYDTTFTGNKTTNAVFNLNHTTDAAFENCTIDGNSGVYIAGVAADASVSFTDTTCSNSSTSRHTFYIAGSLQMRDSMVSKNQAEMHGLALNTGSSTEISNSQFLDNETTGNTIYAKSAEVTINGDSIFRGNRTQQYVLALKDCMVTVDHTQFLNNESKYGTIVAGNGTLTIRNGSVVRSNHAEQYGGGLSVSSNATVTVDQSSCIYNNRSDTQADDVFINGTGVNVTLPNVGVQGLILDPCVHPIDNWYLDFAAERYNAHPTDGAEPYIEAYTGEQAEDGRYTISGDVNLSLKAAHDRLYTITYMVDGEIISELSGAAAAGSTQAVADPYQKLGYWVTDWQSEDVEIVDGHFVMPEKDIVISATTQRIPLLLGGQIRPTLNTIDHFAYIIGYEDGTVRPGNNITRAEVTTIFFRLLTDESRAWFWSQTNSYTDVSGSSWYNNAISTMTNAGIVTGYPDGTFRPNAPITRAEFAAIAARFSDVTYRGGNTFSDVPDTHWASRFIALAEYLGWINGYPDGTFKPDQAITRAEAMTLINRVLERAVETEHMLPDMVTWVDNRPGNWYYEAVQEATNSHEYTRLNKLVPGQDFCYEDWLKIVPVPDWAALETTWSTAYGGYPSIMTNVG